MIEKLLGLDKKLEIAGDIFTAHPPMCPEQRERMILSCDHYLNCSLCQLETNTFCTYLMREIPLLYTTFDNPQKLSQKIREGIENLWQHLKQQKTA
jgi:hypothetical protein